jgi:hypothetical protein
MIEPTKEKFEESVDGCIFDKKEDAEQQLISAASCNLYTKLCGPDGKQCGDVQYTQDNSAEIIAAMAVLKTALKNPSKLIYVYKR